jgi:XTP/dITP diphosphohydrolase
MTEVKASVWIATTNKDKYKEIKELLKSLPLDVHGAFELPHYTSPQENGNTFVENARIKARFLHAMKPEAWTLSDDSGLEVISMKNLPGVHSARYAGPRARDIENTTKLLTQMRTQNIIDRTAQFKCVMILVSPTGEEFIGEGVLKGSVSPDARGKIGFGYDPVFIPEGETKTLAELGMAVKNRLSHRAQALRTVRAHLEGILTRI